MISVHPDWVTLCDCISCVRTEVAADYEQAQERMLTATTSTIRPPISAPLIALGATDSLFMDPTESRRIFQTARIHSHDTLLRCIRSYECVPLISMLRISVPSLLLIGISVSFGQETVASNQIDDDTIIWKIDQPNVKQPEVPYTQIKFQPRDWVWVDAGGCVQTGGTGPILGIGHGTWKRYVDPDAYAGASQDSMYRGRITIPGVPPGPLSPIAAFVNVPGRPFVVVPDAEPGADTSKWFLSLGYLDDNYDDNGYDNHDDGGGDQCKDIGAAWVTITIQHRKDAVVLPPAAGMDLWWDKIDDNTLGVNPRWGVQVTSPGTLPDAGPLCNFFHNGGDILDTGTPPCTTQHPIVDEPPLLSWGNWEVCHFPPPIGSDLPIDSVHGHVNWGIGLYEGIIYFEDWNAPGISTHNDNDYDLDLIRSDEAGVTAGNDFRYQQHGNPGLHVEFDAKEIMDDFKQSWWVKFRDAVGQGHDGDWTAAQALVDTREAKVIGLMGIDNQHDQKAEVHPVHALAIHTESKSCEEHWAIFVRNWGNQGFCSQNQHYLPLNDVVLRFANPDEKTTLTLDTNATDLWGTSSTSWTSSQISEGVLATFHLPDPTERGTIHGELVFKRTPCAPSLSTESSPYRLSEIPAAPAPEIRSEEPETLDLLARYLSPVRRQMFDRINRASLKEIPTRVTTKALRNDTISTTPRARALGGRERRVLLQDVSEFDSVLAGVRQTEYDAFTTALGGPPAVQRFLDRLPSLFRAAQEPMAPQFILGASLIGISVSQYPTVAEKPWQFDILLNGRPAFSVASRSYARGEDYTVSQSATGSIRVQAESTVSLDIFAYHEPPSTANSQLDWDLNSKDPVRFEMVSDQFRLKLSASNSEDDQVRVQVEGVELLDPRRKNVDWTFEVFLNGQAALQVPSRNFIAGLNALVDGGQQSLLDIRVVGYRGELISGHYTINPGTLRSSDLRVLELRVAGQKEPVFSTKFRFDESAIE